MRTLVLAICFDLVCRSSAFAAPRLTATPSEPEIEPLSGEVTFRLTNHGPDDANHITCRGSGVVFATNNLTIAAGDSQTVHGRYRGTRRRTTIRCGRLELTAVEPFVLGALASGGQGEGGDLGTLAGGPTQWQEFEGDGFTLSLPGPVRARRATLLTSSGSYPGTEYTLKSGRLSWLVGSYRLPRAPSEAEIPSLREAAFRGGMGFIGVTSSPNRTLRADPIAPTRVRGYGVRFLLVAPPLGVLTAIFVSGSRLVTVGLVVPLDGRAESTGADEIEAEVNDFDAVVESLALRGK